MSLSKIKIQKTAQRLIGHFDPKAKVEVETAQEVWQINISSEMAPLLIGRRGQTLQAFEHIIRLMLVKEADEFLPIRLDVAGYKASREQEIAQMAREIAQKVLDSGGEESLPPMNSFERRLVHLALAEIEGLETESVGEEPYRKIVVKKK